MERRWVFVLLDMLCVLVGKSRGKPGWCGGRAFLRCPRGGPSAHLPRRAPLWPQFTPLVPGSGVGHKRRPGWHPRPGQQEVAARAAGAPTPAASPFPAAPYQGGDSHGRRPSQSGLGQGLRWCGCGSPPGGPSCPGPRVGFPSGFGES